MNIPPIPSWDAAHPIIVHAPLGALPLAALLAVCALFAVKSRRALAGAVLLALIFGTAGAALASASGDAAEHAAVIPDIARSVFSAHEHNADWTRNLFIIASAAYAVVWGAALIWNERCRRSVWIAVHVIFLAFSAYALLNLAYTGHLGGRLVHEFGVRAPIGGSMDPASRAPAEIEDKPKTRR